MKTSRLPQTSGYMSDEVFRAIGIRLKNMDQINKTDIRISAFHMLTKKFSPISQKIAFISIMRI